MSHNPFRPTFGASPRFWAGRRTALTQYHDAIQGPAGHPDRSIVISGSRGIGKTVLLTELEDIARSHGWLVLRVPSAPGLVDRLVNSIIPTARQEFRGRQSNTRVTGVKLRMLGVDTETSFEDAPVPTLSSELRGLLAELTPHGTGVVISVDEIQDCDPADLRELATAYQDLIRDDLHVSLIVAGLTHGVDKLLDLPGTTFMRRARHFELGPLTDDDSRAILVESATGTSHEFTEAAADAAVALAKGYPYLLQLVGSLAWEHATGDITEDDVAAIRAEAIATMGRQVHQPAVKGLPERQLEFLHAVAHLSDDGAPVRTAEVASLLGRPITALSDTRAKLIARDLLESAGWGSLQFVLPYFQEFLHTGSRPTRIQ